VPAVRPEKVKTIEAGYRATLLKRLYLDVSGYYSWYRDFIGYKLGADIDTFTVQTPFGSYSDIRINNILRVATNAVDQVNTMGTTIGLNYYMGQYFAVVGNYSWNRLDRRGSTDPLIPAFNTPEHKFNIGFNARNFHGFSFNVNYKWISAFRFEGSPQFSGPIDDYDLLDVQVSRQFAKLHTTLKAGAGNVLNNLHYEVYGGPLVGRLVYVSLLYSMGR
jgi:outer membrane receptor protein involved in Fe transport